MITFCRVSGPDTLVRELRAASEEDVIRAAEAGTLVVSKGAGSANALAWIVEPHQVPPDVPGWQIIVLDVGSRATVLDALSRSGAAYLRTSKPREAMSITDLPGVSAVVSTPVASVGEAVAAVRDGAGDLILDDWNSEHIGSLREALGGRLVERAGIPVGVPVDDLRERLHKVVWTAYLRAVDASGVVRRTRGWAPGKDLPIPAPAGRISAEWTDERWVSAAAAPDPLTEARSDVSRILYRSLSGTRPHMSELETLLRARGSNVEAIAWTADRLREKAAGDVVTYVVNRNINYTNVCTYKCRFCAFSKGPRSLELRGEPYLMSVDDVVELATEAWGRGATEVCLQGGIHPGFTGDFYVELVEKIRAAVPEMHIHGFTPLEVWQGASTLGVPVRSYLERLRDAGLGTLPGTAAEILDDRVRRHLCPDKITTSEWADVMVSAHELGLRSTATIMFGHIDDAESWANHFDVLRRIQERTGGFTEFVPLPFVHMGAPIYLKGNARPGPTWDEVVLMHSVGRIAFDGLIPNIQASWVKLGVDGAARLLDAGCNDLGGTLMGEIITRSAGASHGQEVAPEVFESLIRSVGRVPMRRTTLYGVDSVTSV
jgi:7,8-didemethyl-8-hydroxy-5-deazariboflavin synthase CofH subunit